MFYKFFILLSVCLFFNGFHYSAFAEQIVPRKLLIAYQSDKGQKESVNNYFEICQTITDYYGLLSDYLDVNTQAFPDDIKMTNYRAIITVFNSPEMKNGNSWLKWLKHQCDQGKKLIVLGQLSGRDPKQSNEEYLKLVKSIYAYIGLKYEGMYSSHQGRIRYKFKDKKLVEFERPYPIFPKFYEKFVVINEQAKIWLSIVRKDLPDSESAAIITSPNGGFTKDTEIYWMDPVSYKRKWYINPFLFFEEALSLKNFPKLDPTTLNGLRLAFSHIDGDAFSGPSRINPKLTCAEMIRDKVLKKYNYPVTVSVIVAEIAPEAVGNKKLVEIAKSIYALPNIEPASHAFSHPFYWNEYSTEKYKYDHQYGIKIPGYTHDSEKEIVYSLNYISKNLLPPDKPCQVLLWTGACDPTERDLKYCKANQILNMNGGDTVFDGANDSYTSVAPLYRKVGDHYQIHCGQANENILTNLWEGPFYGYKEIIKTMKNTGHPRRLKPIDIYFHFYSGEYESALKALQSVYEWVLQQNVALVYTSDYIKMVNGFLKAKIQKNAQEHFIISNYADCLTVRFDSSYIMPDLKNCQNVLGYSKQSQGLYVSLKPKTDKAIIAFLSSEKPTEHTIPYVESATGWIKDFQVKKDNIYIGYKGFGKGIVKLAGLIPKHKYNIKKNSSKSQSLTSDANGGITINF
ncbi:signal peptide protein [Candidatus Magnetomorum sp. HK-1]|nr:signal peptide protein [Candidatus Magnetomorum sp. HK-1]